VYYRILSYILFIKLIIKVYKVYDTTDSLPILYLSMAHVNNFLNDSSGVWCASRVLAAVSVGRSFVDF
jgi:hypothetical protein